MAPKETGVLLEQQDGRETWPPEQAVKSLFTYLPPFVVSHPTAPQGNSRYS